VVLSAGLRGGAKVTLPLSNDRLGKFPPIILDAVFPAMRPEVYGV